MGTVVRAEDVSVSSERFLIIDVALVSFGGLGLGPAGHLLDLGGGEAQLCPT